MAAKNGVWSTMYHRLLEFPENQSFFVFGARGTGKSTLIEKTFLQENTYFIDLLDTEWEERLNLNPQELESIVKGLPKTITHIVIDEIQKIPKLLDVVHSLIERTNKIFILTGSSAKKLKKGGANLLAGRAFVLNLFPFTFIELEKNFNLQTTLQYGSLPRISHLKTERSCQQFLRSYTQVYLREEIWNEQIVRNLNPFRKFLEVAAQCNGKIINIANIARDVGVDDKTVSSYYHILEDTLLGFYLEPFHHSFRKRLAKKPKFYFFDCGVVRALTNMLTVPLKPGTSAYGEVFEHYIICECLRLSSYLKPDYKFSYLQTKDEVEIDLVLERPAEPLLLIEIKSTTHVKEEYCKNLEKIGLELGEKVELILLSQDKIRKKFGSVNCIFWEDCLREIFGLGNE